MAREDADTSVEQLYTLPLREFTRARNLLAARLRKAGDERAAEVARLPRPSPAAWAVNQVARQDRVGVERLVQAVERLRAAQLQGAPDQLVAREAERAALDQLLTRARTILTGAGFAGSREMMDRVAGTLLGGTSDAARRSDLRQGRLTTELERPGFEVFAGVRPAAAGRPGPPRPGRAKPEPADPQQLQRARDGLRAAEAAAREHTRRAEELERTADQQQRAAEEAARAADAARRRAREAERRVTEAEAAVRAATGRTTR